MGQDIPKILKIRKEQNNLTNDSYFFMVTESISTRIRKYFSSRNREMCGKQKLNNVNQGVRISEEFRRNILW